MGVGRSAWLSADCCRKKFNPDKFDLHASNPQHQRQRQPCRIQALHPPSNNNLKMAVRPPASSSPRSHSTFPIQIAKLANFSHSSYPSTRGPCCKTCNSHPSPKHHPETTPTNFPRAYSVDKDIVVRLKWGGTEYKGRLVSIDSYMNIQLRDTEEFIDSKPTGTLGQVLIRSDNLSVDLRRVLFTDDGVVDVTTFSGFEAQIKAKT